MGEVGSDLMPSLTRGRWVELAGGGGSKELTLAETFGEFSLLPLSRELASLVVGGATVVGGTTVNKVGGVMGANVGGIVGGVTEFGTEVSGVIVFVGVVSEDEKLAQLFVIGGGKDSSKLASHDVEKVGGAVMLKGGGVEGAESTGWLKRDWLPIGDVSRSFGVRDIAE